MFKLKKFIQDKLKFSNKIHLRHNPIGQSNDIIDLIDRFLDGPLRYEMEWDDFISWKNDNAQAERIRLQIEEFENLLTRETIDQYCVKLVDVRNKLAANLGREQRPEFGIE